MTNDQIPEWFQAAIAKLNEKYDEKRQQFKQQGNRYHDGFADGLDAAETIFMREFKNSAPKFDITKIKVERTAFEAAMSKKLEDFTTYVTVDENGNEEFEAYTSEITQSAWEAWQAARQFKPQPASRLITTQLADCIHLIGAFGTSEADKARGLEILKSVHSQLLQMPAEPQSAWISVADRLPESAGAVLVAHKKYGLIKVRLFAGSTFDGEYDSNPVTHWQPLPQPPKQEHENDK